MGELPQIHAGEGLKLGLELGADNFFFAELNELFDVVLIAGLQKGVGEHGREGGRDAHGKTEINPLVGEVVHDRQQRNIGFRDGLIEPIFFEKVLIFGMTNEGKMGMENEAKEALGVIFSAEDHGLAFRESETGGIWGLGADPPRRDRCMEERLNQAEPAWVEPGN